MAKDYTGEIIMGAIALSVVSIGYALFGGKKPAPPASPPPPKTDPPKAEPPPVVILGQPPLCPPPKILLNGNCVDPIIIGQPPLCPPPKVIVNGQCVDPPPESKAIIRTGDRVAFIYKSATTAPGEAFRDALPPGVFVTLVRQDPEEAPEGVKAQAEEIVSFDVAVVHSPDLLRRNWSSGGVEKASVDVYESVAEMVVHSQYYLFQRNVNGRDQIGYAFPPGLEVNEGSETMAVQLTDPAGPPLGSTV